jgi:geranylgeranyl pyrophosphate synthase
MTTQEMNNTATTVTEEELLETGMEAVEEAMREVVSSDVDILKDASHHILNAGGKRVRPRLAMLAYLACGGTDVAYAAPAAGAVELMHTASVVHDDINDHGVLRRGRPSVNAVWGRTFALLTGDFLFTAVYQMMAPYGRLNQVLADAATALVEGETLQAAAVKNNEFTRENYTEIIAKKTAALFQAAGEIGGTLADADEETIEALRQYSYSIGLAFQIVDDILDIVGDDEQLGKTSGIDLEQGRGFAAVENDDSSGANGANGHNDDDDDDGDIMAKVKRKLMKGDRLQEARDQSNALSRLAISHLDILPDSHAKDELIALAKMVVNRQH